MIESVRFLNISTHMLCAFETLVKAIKTVNIDTIDSDSFVIGHSLEQSADHPKPHKTV